MKSLFEPAAVTEVKQRIAQLTPGSPRQWGKMDVAQMLAHCAVSLEQATGDEKPRRMLLGRIFGPMARRRILSEAPMGRNSPTAPSVRITDPRDFNRERQRLVSVIDRFAAGGPAACTTHPHTFFGPMNPDEWARFMYKHLDHHLRQFSA